MNWGLFAASLLLGVGIAVVCTIGLGMSLVATLIACAVLGGAFGYLASRRRS